VSFGIFEQVIYSSRRLFYLHSWFGEGDRAVDIEVFVGVVGFFEGFLDDHAFIEDLEG
jgi:hypothetical protein